jgi:hypothetical protein
MKSDAIAMTMHIRHKKTNPPSMIPIHAIGRPDSFRLRIWFKEIAPKTSARTPKRILVGKHMNPVKGKGITPVQNDRMVRTPNTRLRVDRLLVGELIISLFISIKSDCERIWLHNYSKENPTAAKTIY